MKLIRKLDVREGTYFTYQGLSPDRKGRRNRISMIIVKYVRKTTRDNMKQGREHIIGVAV